MKKPIYLDYHATTPVDPRVLKAMLPYFNEKFGNASSGGHFFGREAKAAVETARAEVAKLINADPSEIIFTSGATEANNLAIKGAALANREKGDHIISVTTEHKSVLDPLKRLEAQGFRVTYLDVNEEGVLDLKKLEASVTPKTILISVMHANNEIGTVHPIDEIARIAQKHGILFFTDAVQSVGKIKIDVKKIGVDLLSFTAHKIYGPKGAGVLYVKKMEPNLRLLPLQDGGGQESGLRSGTLNVPGIVGLGKACEICRKEMATETKKFKALRDRLEKGLMKRLKNCVVNGNSKSRLVNNLNISFVGVESKVLIPELKNIACSTGSACLSTSPEPSFVLKALGLPPERRFSAVRFSVGRFTAQKDVDMAIDSISREVSRHICSNGSKGIK